MHVPPAFQRSDDIALLRDLADPRPGTSAEAQAPDEHHSRDDRGPATGNGPTASVWGGSAVEAPNHGCVVVLDGWCPAYLVARGRADILAVRRPLAERADPAHRLATLGQGTVMPSSTVLGTWQLALAPTEDAHLLPLSTGRLAAIGYGQPSAPPSGLVPNPRAVSVIVAALARGLDAALTTLADALRTGDPPPHAVPITPGQFVSLDAGAAVHTDGGACWLRIAGGHARRNGEDAAVFGAAEPALLTGHDWLTVDGPATAEATTTADLLATGHLPAALDQHMVLTLRSVDRYLDAD